MPQPQEQKQSPQQPQEITLDEWDERVRSHYDIPQKLWRAMAEQESGNNIHAVSPTGVRGRRQVTRATARQYGYNRDDPFEEAAAAGKHLRVMYDGLGHIESDDARWWGALAKYYGGGEAIDRDGNLSERSLDGISNPMEHVNRVARRIRNTEETPQSVSGEQRSKTPAPQYDERGRRKIGARDVGITPVEWPEGKVLDLTTDKFIEPSRQSKYQPLRSLRPGAASSGMRSLRPFYPGAGSGDLVPPAPPRPLTPREKRLADEEVARRNATPVIARMVEAFEGLKREGSLDAARSVAAKIKQQFGRWMEVGEGDGWPYVKSKIPGWNPVQPLAKPITTPSLEDQQRAFAERPLLDQWSERAVDALTRGGGHVSKAARQALGFIAGRADLNPFTSFRDFPDWREGEEARFRELEERRQARPSSFLTEVGEGVIEAIPSAGAMILGTAATGGGLPAAMAFGGGMSAAGADWDDPERALTQTGLGAVAPALGGKAGQSVGGAVARRLTSPAAQATARAGGELLGGGAGNVLASGAEQLAFEGRISPRESAKQFVVGSALNAPGALRSLRPGAGQRSPRPSDEAARADIPIEARPTRRLLPPAEPVQSRADLPIFLDENAPTAELPAQAQGRVTAPLREPQSSGRAPASEIDTLYDQFATQRGKAVAKQADEQEALAVTHRNPEIDRKPILAKTQDDRVIVENPNNKSGVSVVKDRSDSPSEHKFSSTQANLPKDLADEITAFGRRIPDRDLAGDGRETAPHITLKYGLHGWDPKFAQEALAGEGPITVRFGKVSLFQNDDADVVKVDVESEGLRRLNQKIAEAHPNTETHSTYEPHATIAYVRPGRGAKYAGSNFLEGHTITLDRITFSGRDGKQVEIPLTGRRAGSPAEAVQVAGEPVSPRWLNAQRRRAAELLGIDPDQVPMVDEAPEVAPQNLQTPRPQPAGVRGPAAARGESPLDVGPGAAPAAATRTKQGGQILGSGFGGLQSLFERASGAKPPKPSEPSPEGSRRGRIFETIGAAQTVGQLGSPGFVMRNIIGHASHGAQEMITRGVGGVLDKAASVLTGKRTVGGFRSPLDAAKEIGRFAEDYKAGVKAAREAVRRGEPLPGSRLRDMPDPETLTAFGRRLQKILTYINEVPDAGAWNAHFQASLRDQAREIALSRGKPSADKSLQRVDEMIERAWAGADHASLRDKNVVSDSLRRLKKTLNTTTRWLTGTEQFGLGDFVVKYVQIPGAIMKRGIEYSPIGIFEAGYYATKGDRRRAVQSLSRAVVGSTSGAGVGAALAAMGILVGPERDEGQLAQLEREEGVRGYSINLSALKRLAGGGWDDPESGRLQAGDQLVGIDWLQPWALQASAGAAVYNLYSKGDLRPGSAAKATGEAVYESLAKALDVFGDQSVLKNLGRYMSRATGETTTEKFTNFFKAVGLDVPSSFVPSLARQTRQVLDPYERDTRPEDPEDFFGEAKSRALAQLPGVSQTFPTRPSVLTGQPKKTAIGDYSSPVRGLRMLSPAPFTTYRPSDVAQEAARLTDAGFKVAFSMPKREKGERTSGLRRREERFADSFSSQAPKLLNHPFYRLADDEAKAESLNDLAKQLRAATRKTIDAKTVDEIIDRAGDRIENRRRNRLK